MEKTSEELEKDLTLNIAKYPNLKQLVEKSLTEDLHKGQLENNGILQAFLDPNDFLKIQENTLTQIIQHDPEALPRLRKKLRGATGERFVDTWVEVLAYESLVKNDFVDIEVVSETSSKFPKRKPDLLATKEKDSYLIEVSRISALPDPVDYIFQRIRALYIQNPQKFNRMFDVSVRGFGDLIRFDDFLLNKINTLMQDVSENINAKQIFIQSWSNEERDFEIRIQSAEGRFSMVGGGEVMSNKILQRVENLASIGTRLLARASQKITQLQMVDPDYNSKHLVLIKLEKTAPQNLFWDDEIKKLTDVILKQEIPIIDPNTQVEAF